MAVERGGALEAVGEMRVVTYRASRVAGRIGDQ